MPDRPTRNHRYTRSTARSSPSALPTFATLVTEPMLLIADSAFIGHLGTDQLAGLGIAANVIGIVVGLCIFLAYGTTSTVARRLGAGDRGRPWPAGSTDWSWQPDRGGARRRAADAAADHRRRVRAVGGGTGGRAGLPAGGRLRAAGRARAAGRDRRPARTAGHHDAAQGRGRHQPGQHRLERDPRVRRRAGYPRVGHRDPDRPDRRRRRDRRHRGPRGPAGRGPAGLPPQRRVRGGPRRRLADRPDGDPAGGDHADHGGGCGGRDDMLAAYQVVNSIWVLLAFALDAIAIAGQAIIGRTPGRRGRGDRTRDDHPDDRLGRGLRGGVRLVVAVGGQFVAAIFTPDPQVQQLVGRRSWWSRSSPRSPASCTCWTAC